MPIPMPKWRARRLALLAAVLLLATLAGLGEAPRDGAAGPRASSPAGVEPVTDTGTGTGDPALLSLSLREIGG